MRVLQINLVQGLIITNLSLTHDHATATILAGYSRHNNRIIINKPNIGNHEARIVKLLVNDTKLLKQHPAIIYSDSFSLSFYNPTTGGDTGI